MIIKKSYKNLMTNIGRSHAKLMKNLRRHYRYLNEIIKFMSSDVIRERGKPSSEAVIGRIL